MQPHPLLGPHDRISDVAFDDDVDLVHPLAICYGVLERFESRNASTVAASMWPLRRLRAIHSGVSPRLSDSVRCTVAEVARPIAASAGERVFRRSDRHCRSGVAVG